MTVGKLLKYNIPLFEGVSSSALEACNLVWNEQSFSSGQTLFTQNDKTNDVYFLLSGLLNAVYFTQEGREIIFTRFPIGSYLGELSAIDSGARSLAVYARSPSRLLCMKQASFISLIDQVPQIRERLMCDMAARIRYLTEKTLELTTLTIQQRVCSYLIRLALETNCLRPNGMIEKAPTHAEIAGSIGANREMVSRTMARLSKEKIIETARQKIKILDPKALEKSVQFI